MKKALEASGFASQTGLLGASKLKQAVFRGGSWHGSSQKALLSLWGSFCGERGVGFAYDLILSHSHSPNQQLLLY